VTDAKIFDFISEAVRIKGLKPVAIWLTGANNTYRKPIRVGAKRCACVLPSTSFCSGWNFINKDLEKGYGAFFWLMQLKKQDVNDRIIALTQLTSYYVYIGLIFNYVIKGKKKGRTISSPAFMGEEVTAVTSSLFQALNLKDQPDLHRVKT
jgi:hypothetical protein